MNQRIRARITAVAAAAAVLGFAQSAQAVRLGFENLPHSEDMTGVGDVVSHMGFTLTYSAAPGEQYPVGFFVMGPSWRSNGRSAALQANSCSAITTMQNDMNLPFTVRSIDLAAGNGDDGAAVTFVAMTTTYTYVHHTFVLDGPTWKTYRLPEKFTNLLYVKWVQGDCLVNPVHMFDNVRVHPTAQPDTDG